MLLLTFSCYRLVYLYCLERFRNILELSKSKEVNDKVLIIIYRFHEVSYYFGMLSEISHEHMNRHKIKKFLYADLIAN